MLELPRARRVSYERVDVEESKGLVGLKELHGGDVSYLAVKLHASTSREERHTLDDLAKDAVGRHLVCGHSLCYLDVLIILSHLTGALKGSGEHVGLD